MSPIIRSVTYAEVYAILLDLGLPVITRSMKAFFTRIWRVKTPSVSNFVYISILIYSNLRQKNTALNVNGKMPQFFYICHVTSTLFHSKLTPAGFVSINKI